MRWLHRTNKKLADASPRQMEKQHGGSFTDANGHLQDNPDWITNPDMSPVDGVLSKYWIITGDAVSEMSQGEKDAVDAVAMTVRRDAAVNSAIDNLEGDLRQLVKLMISEINILRAEHGLADRTMAQFKIQIRNGYGS